MSSTCTWTMDLNGTKVVVTATAAAGGGVQFSIVSTGPGDLNGFFLDLGNDGFTGASANGTRSYSESQVTLNGGKVLPPEKNTNMNGAGDGWDYGIQIGTGGGNDTDVTSATVVIKNITLDAVKTAQVGIRMQSTDDPDNPLANDREGSLKLTALCDQDDDDDDDEGDFPDWFQDISNLTFVFKKDDANASGDTKTKPDGDGYYTIKLDVDDAFLGNGGTKDGGTEDLDDIIAVLLQSLQNKSGSLIDANSDLMGVVIKGGQPKTDYFAFGDYNKNGDAPDALPTGIGFSLPGDNGNIDPTNAVDREGTYYDGILNLA